MCVSWKQLKKWSEHFDLLRIPKVWTVSCDPIKMLLVSNQDELRLSFLSETCLFFLFLYLFLEKVNAGQAVNLLRINVRYFYQQLYPAITVFFFIKGIESFLALFLFFFSGHIRECWKVLVLFHFSISKQMIWSQWNQFFLISSWSGQEFL